ncbi:MAG: DUF1553 domain-containing protein [Pirellulaceae bacterium]|nr:DUF1553 domain-containing protein [Pirellulaceae bacterium]
MPTPNRILAALWFVGTCCFAQLGFSQVEPTSAPAAEAEQIEFFESQIRPLLIKHCLECHANDTEASGGLLLDSRPNWERGGDSGDAIIPRDPASSLLMRAVQYDDPDLQMPPDGKLPASAIEALRVWIEKGAADPRSEVSVPRTNSKALSVANAQEHWAYRPVIRPELPKTNSSTAVDAFIDAKLEAAGVQAAPLVSRAQWLRRLTFDLHGLPPDPNVLAAFEADTSSDAEARMLDRLLDSPRFGETFARHWMDVVRYAESVTLRGFVLPEAWRYRDYLIEAFNDDRPFDQMIIEQVAGDLLAAEDRQERTRQLVATSFLTLGNTNLEEQDKTQLEMDYIDEQLEVLGRAFLAQTIGCARCHDHKFDPIPTRDYYALAGIFRNTIAMEHENVSKWVEQPLPIEPDQAAKFDQWASDAKRLTQKIASLKKKSGDKVDPNKSIDASTLEGIVIDDVDTKLIGDWIDGTTVAGYVSSRYLHDGNSGKGEKSATFEPKHLAPGEYRVRMSYTPAPNRASNAKVVVFSADGEKAHRVNQQQAPDDGIWISLGNYRFEKDGQAFVIVSNSEADGHVVIDAIQFLPIALTNAADSAIKQASEKSSSENSLTAKLKAEVDEQELKSLEKELAALKVALDARPRFMTVREQTPAKDIPIHIRGNVHNLGEVVPRGFLTALDVGNASQVTFDEDSSGRLPLARWLSDTRNPLTARVYANRVWSWLIGQGLVATTNNFGTTGNQPSHPELLDWLADELMRSGWSTKHLVRCIVLSDAYRRAVVDATSEAQRNDVANQWLWRGNLKRVTVESLRDAMLSVSGELDLAIGGSMIKPSVKEDYNYPHQATRRSLYHPVLRNSLPELFEAFDFADTSVSIGERARSTVAPQALIMMNHPWVVARAAATAKLIEREFSSAELAVEHLYRSCYGRASTDVERAECVAYLVGGKQDSPSELDSKRLMTLAQSLFAALDFRYLE